MRTGLEPIKRRACRCCHLPPASIRVPSG
jgi:hypothetical protein